MVYRHVVMNKTEAYKQGLQSGLEDWVVTGSPHRTRECPMKEFDHRIQWQLGRAHGFMEADQIIHPEKESEDN